MATGELWPDPAAEVPPLAVRFTSRYRAQFNRGTPGRPDIVECLLLDTPETTVAEPTSIELARFSRASSDPNRRTAIVSSGEECLVASHVVGLTAGCVVRDHPGGPASQPEPASCQAGQQYENVSRWLAAVPKATAPQGTELPLRRALSELRDVASERTQAGKTFEADAILSRVELCLSRFVDQFQYLHGIDAEADPGPGSAAVLGARFGLTADDAGSPGRFRARDHSASRSPVCFWRRPTGTAQRCRSLAAAAVQFTALAQTTSPSSALTSLVEVSDRLVRSAHDLIGGCRCPAGGVRAATRSEARRT